MTAPPHDDAPHHLVATQFRRQAQWCHELGSPLYGRLLERVAADCERGGVTWSILEGHERDPTASALPLRFMGAVHRLVLQARAPALAPHYPSVGGRVCGGDAAWEGFCDTVAAQREPLRELIQRPVQTNEVGRSACLLGGFLTVAQATRLPLRLLEIGASAGLNLRWDRYWYESGGAGWGDRESPVRFRDVFAGAHPGWALEVAIAERAGCDASPLDPSTEEGRLTLRSYLWPDQAERWARLDGALDVAARVPAAVARADALDWLTVALAHRVEGVATVVFHSIVMQYLGREGARAVMEIIRAAGERATGSAPLAWLWLEPAKNAAGQWEYRVFLTTWPPAEARVLALASPHGPPVRWLA